MMISSKELFKRFLLDYITRRCNVGVTSEIYQLTDEWFEWPDIVYFSSDAVRSYLDYIIHNVKNDDDVRLYYLTFDESRYSDLIKNYNHFN